MTRRKRIIYGSVIGLGAVGVLVDRIVSGGAGPVATATAAGPASVAARSAAKVDPAAVQISIRPAPFPGPILGDGALSAPGRDPFDVSTAALAVLQPDAAAGTAGRNGAAGRGSRLTFQAEHRLEAVFQGTAGAAAVVDGVLLQVGQTLDGCRLETIHPRSAVFACGDGRAEIDLEALLPGASGIR